MTTDAETEEWFNNFIKGFETKPPTPDGLESLRHAIEMCKKLSTKLDHIIKTYGPNTKLS